MDHIVREVEGLRDLQLQQGIIAEGSCLFHATNISPKREQDTCMAKSCRCRKGPAHEREIADDGDRKLDSRGHKFWILGDHARIIFMALWAQYSPNINVMTS